MNLPEAFIQKYQALLGPEAAAFLKTFEQSSTSGFRTNPLRPPLPLGTVGEAVPWSAPWGHYGKINGNHIDHVSGYVYSQEPSAQFVGATVAPQPGEWVLDLCAAPGGKTTHLASYMQGAGVLVANEINAGRAKVLASNVERCGIPNTIITNNDPDTLAAIWPGQFDRILVDAPCSGEGMFRKDPEAMRYWHEDYPAECAKRQQAILQAAVTMLKPGGTLVYSTCTFAPEEDEQVASWAQRALDLTLIPIGHAHGIQAGRPEWAAGDPTMVYTARLWPHHLSGEGHFVAKFKKATGAPARPLLAASPKRLSAEQRRDFDTFVHTSLTTLPKGALWATKDQLFLVPAGGVRLAGVHLVRAGVHLGTFKKQRFEASHSLATAWPPTVFQTVVELTADEYARYRHGEVLPTALKGKQTVLLTHDGKGFALGKLVNGTIKNAYPKGLRV